MLGGAYATARACPIALSRRDIPDGGFIRVIVSIIDHHSSLDPARCSNVIFPTKYYSKHCRLVKLDEYTNLCIAANNMLEALRYEINRCKDSSEICKNNEQSNHWHTHSTECSTAGLRRGHGWLVSAPAQIALRSNWGRSATDASETR